MIDLEKLRELAEDDVKRGRQWSTNSRDVLMLLDHIAALEKEVQEQCRVNGMGSEREASLLSRVAALEKDAERNHIPDDMGYKSIDKDGPVGMALQWLRASLDCKAFQWDWDQRECAEQSYMDAKTWMEEIGPVPESIDTAMEAKHG